MEAYISTIMGWGPNWAPRAWALCDGQLLAISQYSAVFSLIGTIYGGDGRTTFALPDLRGRAPLGWGNGPGLSNHSIGQKTGTEQVTLNVNQLPSHSHTATAVQNCYNAAGDAGEPSGQYMAASLTGDRGFLNTFYHNQQNATMQPPTVTVQNTGGSQPFSVVQPVLAISFIFCLQGIFPPRN